MTRSCSEFSTREISEGEKQGLPQEPNERRPVRNAIIKAKLPWSAKPSSEAVQLMFTFLII